MKILFVKNIIYCSFLLLLIQVGCRNNTSVPNNNGKIKTVSTITIINDIVKSIGKEKVETFSICEVGIDPHTYKSKPSDPKLIANADIVFINGLNLEHWIEKMIQNSGGNKLVVNVSDGITPLTDESGFGDPDPHAWFDLIYLKTYAENIAKGLITIDKQNEKYYLANLEEYKLKLDSLDNWTKTEISKIPQEKRILITSHDAFRYFGVRYGIQVKGLQGISTEAKVQTNDVKKIIDLIKEKNIKAVFIETSVNPKMIQEITGETGAVIGGTLFSDSIGNEGTEEGTFIGAFKHNVKIIVNSLK